VRPRALHLLAWLPAGCDEARLVAAASERGIGITASLRR